MESADLEMSFDRINWSRFETGFRSDYLEAWTSRPGSREANPQQFDAVEGAPTDGEVLLLAVGLAGVAAVSFAAAALFEMVSADRERLASRDTVGRLLLALRGAAADSFRKVGAASSGSFQAARRAHTHPEVRRLAATVKRADEHGLRYLTILRDELTPRLLVVRSSGGQGLRYMGHGASNLARATITQVHVHRRHVQQIAGYALVAGFAVMVGVVVAHTLAAK